LLIEQSRLGKVVHLLHEICRRPLEILEESFLVADSCARRRRTETSSTSVLVLLQLNHPFVVHAHLPNKLGPFLCR
jgi:hypothetical protein